MHFLSRYFTNLHPPQRKERRYKAWREVGPVTQQALCPCCFSSFPAPAMLLLINTSNSGVMDILQACSEPVFCQLMGAYEYALWHGKPDPQGVVEEKAGTSSLRDVKGSHLLTSVTGQRSSPPYTPMLRLPLCSRFGILCSRLPYYEEGS